MFKIACKYLGYRYRQHRRKTSEKIVVDTIYGPVRGVKRISCWNDAYYSFERIPFAKPPVGELRFSDPVPPEPWKNIKNCGRETPMPSQHNLILKVVHGTENCLFLNVYSPKIHSEQLKPVMVWIYGGGFEMGGANRMIYGPDYFMQKDVVLVTINYRVGALGFLSLKDPKAKVPGNAGLKDQILGLKWVNANIKNFGGDPNNVTLFGESAGGASTHYLMLTEQTKGLFHKAILMSGTAFAPWASTKGTNLTYRLARKLGYNGEDNDERILKFLRGKKAAAIAAANGRLLTKLEKQNGIIFAHGPIIEPYISEQCVVPKDPVIMARETWSNQMPVIMGGCAHEGYIFMFATKKLNIKKEVGNCETLVPDHLKTASNEIKSQSDHLDLKKLYFGNKEPTLFPFLELLAHRNFWHPIRRTVKSRLEYATAPTYLYRFDVDSDFNLIRTLLCGDSITGTCHGDDILYLFFGLLTSSISRNSMEYKAIQRLVGMWTQFAKTGNPNIQETESNVWEPVCKTDSTIKCLNINENLSKIDFPHKEHLDVWDSFYTNDLLI